MMYKKKFDLYQGEEHIMRLGLGMNLFFPRPFKDVKSSIWELWQRYLAFVGENSFTWARLGGGNRSRKVSSSTFKTIKSWLHGEKDYGDTCWISIHDGLIDTLGQHSFILEGYDQVVDYDTRACFIEMAFPLNFLELFEPAQLADHLIKIADPVPLYCGNAGLIFHRSPYKFQRTIGQMAKLSRRFEGVEISANEELCFLASKGLASINWLTFLSRELINRLGGVDTMTANLPAECVTTPLRHGGMVLRLSEKPLLGDRNSGRDELKIWRQAYQVLKQVQFIDLEFEFDSSEFDAERTAEWLQRLNWQYNESDYSETDRE